MHVPDRCSGIMDWIGCTYTKVGWMEEESNLDLLGLLMLKECVNHGEATANEILRLRYTTLQLQLPLQSTVHIGCLSLDLDLWTLDVNTLLEHKAFLREKV